jgi:hypothetical protein
LPLTTDNQSVDLLFHRTGNSETKTRRRRPYRSRNPWTRALLLEARRRDMVVSILNIAQNWSKKPRDLRGMIQAVLIILVSTVAVVGFLYLALALSDHH